MLGLAIGFGAFLIWHIVVFLHLVESLPSHWFPLIAHIAVTFVLAGCAAILCRKCELSATTLRAGELLIFFLPASYFLIWYTSYIQWYADEHGVLPHTEGTWLMLMFVYALFIPNSWLRAAGFISSFALMPIILATLLVMFDENCGAAPNGGFPYMSQLVLKMLIAGATGSIAFVAVPQAAR